MSDARNEERQDATHSDEDPLLQGERSSVVSIIRRNLPSFSLRGWGRSRVREDAPETQDVEAGLEPAAHNARTSSGNESEVSSQTREAESGGPSSEATAEARSTSPPLSDRQSLGGSPSARSGLLGDIFRLGSSSLQQRGSSSSLGSNPICLICLEPLTPEDFEGGEAIILDCQCRGDMAMRHRTCAEKWVHVKGNRICDVCKTVVKNLPDVPPRAPDAASTPGGPEDPDTLRNNMHILAAEQVPGGADVVFDCIRVTWVAMIICILFFDMSLANALWTGLIVGFAYTLFVRAMYRHQLAAIMREQQRMAAEGNHAPPHVVHVV